MQSATLEELKQCKLSIQLPGESGFFIIGASPPEHKLLNDYTTHYPEAGKGAAYGSLDEAIEALKVAQVNGCNLPRGEGYINSFNVVPGISMIPPPGVTFEETLARAKLAQLKHERLDGSNGFFVDCAYHDQCIRFNRQQRAFADPEAQLEDEITLWGDNTECRGRGFDITSFVGLHSNEVPNAFRAVATTLRTANVWLYPPRTCENPEPFLASESFSVQIRDLCVKMFVDQAWNVCAENPTLGEWLCETFPDEVQQIIEETDATGLTKSAARPTVGEDKMQQ